MTLDTVGPENVALGVDIALGVNTTARGQPDERIVVGDQELAPPVLVEVANCGPLLQRHDAIEDAVLTLRGSFNIGTQKEAVLVRLPLALVANGGQEAVGPAAAAAATEDGHAG
jgi:hypothetical protein